MIRDFKRQYPTWFNFILAGLMGVFIWLSSLIGSDEYLWLRVCYAVASVLLFVDVLETLYIARANATFRQPVFWVYAFYIGYVWAYLMVLIMWQGMESLLAQIVTWGIAGMVFGTIMAFLSKYDEDSLIIGKYDLDSKISKNKFNDYYVRFSPLVIIVILVLFFYFVGDDISNREPYYLLWFILFMGSLVVRDNRKPVHYFRLSEKYVGLTLLTIAILALYLCI